MASQLAKCRVHLHYASGVNGFCILILVCLGYFPYELLASPAGAADLLSEEAHASDPVVSDGVRASPAASSASRHSMVEEQPEISKEQLLHEMVKSLQQELTTERDKVRV